MAARHRRRRTGGSAGSSARRRCAGGSRVSPTATRASWSGAPLYDAVGGYPDTAASWRTSSWSGGSRGGPDAPAPRADPRRCAALAAGGTRAGHAPERGAALAVPRRRGAGPACALVSTGAPAPMMPAVAVFLKAPRLGTVKTRLAAEIGRAAGAPALSCPGGTGPRRGAPGGPRGYRLVHAQLTPGRRCGTGWARAGTCGRRHRAISARAWPRRRARCRPGAAGSPSGPTVRASTPRSCARPRRSSRAMQIVLGPSWDGGYYLSGGPTPLPDLFSAMPWSTEPGARGDARATVRTRRRPGTSCVTLRDVDTAEDARAEGLLT